MDKIEVYSAPVLASRDGYFPSGTYFGCDGALSTATLGSNALVVAPVAVARRVSIDEIGVYVSGAANTVRLAIYADDGTGKPGALVATTSGITATTTGYKSATLNVTLPPGLYWVGQVAQNANATVVTIAGYRRPVTSTTAADLLSAATGLNGYIATGVTGVPPSTFTIASRSGSTPLVVMRAV